MCLNCVCLESKESKARVESSSSRRARVSIALRMPANASATVGRLAIRNRPGYLKALLDSALSLQNIPLHTISPVG